MSSRPLITPFPAVVNGDMSANITSAVTIIKMLSMVSYSVSWAGTAPVGTISVQVSNDYSQNEDGTVRNPGTWNTMVLNVGGVPTSAIPISGNTGNGFVDVDQTAAYAMRLIYTRTSGTGLMQVILAAKVA